MIEYLKDFLEERYLFYNQPQFIEEDPVFIPHRFSNKKDIEIAGFFAAVLAWGLRKTILNKCKELLEHMDNAPYDFVLHHSENDLRNLISFKHRTFNATDLLYFIHFLKKHYLKHDSLEEAFFPDHCLSEKTFSMEKCLQHFHNCFFNSDIAPERTRKHISTPASGSACKRLNMFLRWMVRKDKINVDFGIWNKIRPSHLICPMDIHVFRVASKLHLLERNQPDWKAAWELTLNLKKFDPDDPVKYDYALFGLGVIEKF